MRIYPLNTFCTIRTKKGYTGATLAAKVGLSRQHMSQFEKRKSGISPANALKITKVLDVEFDDLFEIVD